MNKRLTSVKLLTAASLLALGFCLPQTASASEYESACKTNVQGKISWDPGSVEPKAKVWKDENLDRLCKGAKNPTGPGECFDKLMIGNIRWGDSDKWEWENAVSLCAGADNADERINCFKGRIDAGEKWDTAIFQCQANNSIGNTVK